MDGPALSLSGAFRQRTGSLHTQAERSGIVRDLLKRQITLAGYSLFLRNLLPAYKAMEGALEARRQKPAFQGIARPEIYRAASIEADLTAMCGPSWGHSLPLLAAGERYAARIAEVAKGDGFGLIAHAYARYLGDVNGGQILKRLLMRSLGLTTDALAFYDFPAIQDLDGFKISYRGALDQSEHDIGAIEPVIEEAAIAFELNILISEAVQQAVTGDNSDLTTAPPDTQLMGVGHA